MATKNKLNEYAKMQKEELLDYFYAFSEKMYRLWQNELAKEIHALRDDIERNHIKYGFSGGTCDNAVSDILVAKYQIINPVLNKANLADFFNEQEKIVKMLKKGQKLPFNDRSKKGFAMLNVFVNVSNFVRTYSEGRLKNKYAQEKIFKAIESILTKIAKESNELLKNFERCLNNKLLG